MTAKSMRSGSGAGWRRARNMRRPPSHRRMPFPNVGEPVMPQIPRAYQSQKLFNRAVMDALEESRCIARLVLIAFKSSERSAPRPICQTPRLEDDVAVWIALVVFPTNHDNCEPARMQTQFVARERPTTPCTLQMQHLHLRTASRPLRCRSQRRFKSRKKREMIMLSPTYRVPIYTQRCCPSRRNNVRSVERFFGRGGLS